MGGDPAGQAIVRSLGRVIGGGQAQGAQLPAVARQVVAAGHREATQPGGTTRAQTLYQQGGQRWGVGFFSDGERDPAGGSGRQGLNHRLR